MQILEVLEYEGGILGYIIYKGFRLANGETKQSLLKMLMCHCVVVGLLT